MKVDDKIFAVLLYFLSLPLSSLKNENETLKDFDPQ